MKSGLRDKQTAQRHTAPHSGTEAVSMRRQPCSRASLLWSFQLWETSWRAQCSVKGKAQVPGPRLLEGNAVLGSTGACHMCLSTLCHFMSVGAEVGGLCAHGMNPI